METIYSLALLFAAFTFGMIAIAIMIFIMGLGGSLGAIVYAVGSNLKSRILIHLGLVITAIGQSLVIGIYGIFLVGAVRTLQDHRPSTVMWPLWIGVWFLTLSPHTHAMKDQTAPITPQCATLPFAGTAGLLTLLIAIFRPVWLEPWFNWVPFFGANLS